MPFCGRKIFAMHFLPSDYSIPSFGEETTQTTQRCEQTADRTQNRFKIFISSNNSKRIDENDVLWTFISTDIYSTTVLLQDQNRSELNTCSSSSSAHLLRRAKKGKIDSRSHKFKSVQPILTLIRSMLHLVQGVVDYIRILDRSVSMSQMSLGVWDQTLQSLTRRQKDKYEINSPASSGVI